MAAFAGPARGTSPAWAASLGSLPEGCAFSSPGRPTGSRISPCAHAPDNRCHPVTCRSCRPEPRGPPSGRRSCLPVAHVGLAQQLLTHPVDARGAAAPSQVTPPPLAHSQRRISSSKPAESARNSRRHRVRASLATVRGPSNMALRYPTVPAANHHRPTPVGCVCTVRSRMTSSDRTCLVTPRSGTSPATTTSEREFLPGDPSGGVAAGVAGRRGRPPRRRDETLRRDECRAFRVLPSAVRPEDLAHLLGRRRTKARSSDSPQLTSSFPNAQECDPSCPTAIHHHRGAARPSWAV